MSKIFVKAGKVLIGGGNPISIQSMTNTKTSDVEATVEQILRLEKAGCDIVRLAVSSEQEVEACRTIVGRVGIPLVADIQFDYRLAVSCADIGFDKIRFNPGNIGDEGKVREVVSACKRNGVPIRVGVNAGSLEKSLLDSDNLADALCASALSHVKILEKHGFYDTVISVKSSNVKIMVEAYRKLALCCDYPLHLGVTESGTKTRGIVKSSVGIGSLLLDGIGDTIRVSLTGDPVKEVEAAKLILQSAGLLDNAVEIVSCPTCSRCNYNMEAIVDELESRLSLVNKRLKIAVMGCVVNGPGEARDADVAVCGGANGKAAIYANGKHIMTVDVTEVVPKMLDLIKKIS